MKLLRQLRALFRREKLDAEMAEEMRHHLDAQLRRNLAAGLSLTEAHAAARRSFGGVEQIKEQCRDERGWRWLDQVLQDGRYALRQLRKSPAFALIAIVTLALGIGANTAIFSAINVLLLRALPVSEPRQLVVATSGANENFSYPAYERYRDQAQSFAGMAVMQFGMAPRELRVTAQGGEVENVSTQAVSVNFFSLLGVRAALGRALAPTDERPGSAEPVAVVSYDFWQRRFGGDPGVLGRVVQVDQVSVSILGVMPREFAGFQLGTNPDVWLPMQLVSQLGGGARTPWLTDEGVEWLVILGRLRPGVDRRQAQAEMTGLLQQHVTATIARNPKWTESERRALSSQAIQLLPGGSGYTPLRQQFMQPLAILMTVVVVVLLIACANVGGLLLARGAARQREFAVRAALGAGRGRIVRQLVTESMLLAFLGGALGWVLARWGTDLLASYLPARERGVALAPDGNVLSFTFLVSAVSGAIFGLVPAWRLSRLDLVSAIKQQTGQTAGGARSRLQPALVVAQIALSVLLFAGAGLFVRTLHNLKTLDLGFRRENVIGFSIDFGRGGRDPTRKLDVHRQVLTALENLPGVKDVTLSGAGLLSNAGYATGVSVEGYTPAPDESMRASGIVVGPKFFATMGVPLLRGREFNDREQTVPADPTARGRLSVIILGEAMAKKYFGDADPVGRHVTLGLRDGTTVEIIGVARDTTYRQLREKTPLEFYVPYFGGLQMMPMVFRLHTAGEPLAVAPDIRRLVQQIDPKLNVKDLRTMEDVVDSQLVQERVLAQLAGFFSVFALTLASLGLYGTLSYAVARRTREIGVRMALGASVRNVLGLVVRQGLALAVLGCAAGLAGAFALTRLVTSLLYGVDADDPLTFAATALVLVVVALLACWLPARRAAKVDPMVALRCE